MKKLLSLSLVKIFDSFSEKWPLRRASLQLAPPTMLRICALNESSSEDEVHGRERKESEAFLEENIWRILNVADM